MPQLEQRPRPTSPLKRLSRMTLEQRRARAASFSRAERLAWAANFPEEVPLINGELAWITLRLADLD